MMLRRLALVVGLAGGMPLAACASAAPPPGDRVYEDTGYVTLQIVPLDAGRARFAARIAVGTQGCGGSVSGFASLVDHTLTLQGQDVSNGLPVCTVQVRFDHRFARATVVEDEGCLAYHGGSCSFETEVKLKPGARPEEYPADPWLTELRARLGKGR